MEGKQRATGGVQSIERAFAIIELLDAQGELGIAEMSRLLSLERSTVHRIVSTIKNLGYINQNPLNHKYSNSFKFFEIGNDVVKRLGLRQQAAPFLRELSEKTHEAVNLAILDGDRVIYIDKIESQSTIKVDLSVGKRFPA
ncbi:MAG TPA: IclR family transcriptional regulator, partial [Synergistales bacterium]|nr:IclR family transcriptional regulator [Synergistales bacterium]